MIAITGANGNLGQLVVNGLLQRIPANQIVAAVRNPEKANDLRVLGVQVREGDYDRPETLLRLLKVWRNCRSYRLYSRAKEPGNTRL